MKTPSPIPPGLPQSRPLIGFGQVWHRRLRPALHEFRHASYFWLLPMRSLRAAPEPMLNRNRFGALSFHDRDHGAGGDDALAWVEQILANEDVQDADGEIWLHTYPHVLGHVFKPVSFWFAMRGDGGLAAVLAEVNNTFGQRHVYLLQGPALRWGGEVQATKVFHVSPFCDTKGQYRFRFQRSVDVPADAGHDAPAIAPAWQHLVARVALDTDDGPLLQTSVGGRLLPMSPATLRRAFFGHPLQSLGVVGRIHWHALRLAIKRVSFHRLPEAPDRFLTR